MFPCVVKLALAPLALVSATLGTVTAQFGGSGSGVEWQADWLNGNREVASSIPGSPRVTVEVSLSKILNP